MSIGLGISNSIGGKISGFGGGPSYDPDALAYFTAAGITDVTEKDAANQLVLDLKGIGSTPSGTDLWTDAAAFYPISPTSLTASGYNLRDTTSFNMTWVNSPTHAPTHTSNGVTFNGTTQYGDTGFNPSTASLANGYDLTLGMEIVNASVTAVGLMSAFLSTGSRTQMLLNSGNIYQDIHNTSGGRWVTSTGGIYQGRMIVSADRLANGGRTNYLNGTSLGTKLSENSGTPVNLSLFVGAQNNGSGGQNFTAFEMRFGLIIPKGLNATEVADLDDAIARYLTAVRPLILDIYSGAAAAYSVRKLSSSYSGSALRVRRSSDNAEQDIGFSGNDLDTVSMESFVGANNGFVVTWYDQSGNGNDATNATAVEQSQIVSSGVTVTEGTRPAATYDGTMSYSLTRFSYSNLSVSSVYKLTSLPANGSTMFSQNLGFIQKSGQATTAYPRFQIYDTGYKTAEFQTTALNAYNHQIGLTDAGTARIFVNGITGTTEAYGTINNPNNVIKLGNFPSVANTGHIGTIQEIIAWDSNEAANRAGIESNTNSYYAIY